MNTSTRRDQISTWKDKIPRFDFSSFYLYWSIVIQEFDLVTHVILATIDQIHIHISPLCMVKQHHFKMSIKVNIIWLHLQRNAFSTNIASTGRIFSSSSIFFLHFFPLGWFALCWTTPRQTILTIAIHRDGFFFLRRSQLPSIEAADQIWFVFFLSPRFTNRWNSRVWLGRGIEINCAISSKEKENFSFLSSRFPSSRFAETREKDWA